MEGTKIITLIFFCGHFKYNTLPRPQIASNNPIGPHRYRIGYCHCSLGHSNDWDTGHGYKRNNLKGGG